MSSINEIRPKYNRILKVDIDGGDLSSDEGQSVLQNVS